MKKSLNILPKLLVIKLNITLEREIKERGKERAREPESQRAREPESQRAREPESQRAREPERERERKRKYPSIYSLFSPFKKRQ